MPASRTQADTEEHRGPEPSIDDEGEPALVVVNPTAIALPLPEAGAAVGRSWFAQHGVEDTEISREHVVVTRAGGQLQIADAGSRNGTWLDGARLEEDARVALHDGGVLRVGKTLCVYREGLRGARTAAPPLGELVGPFGLRDLAAAIDGLVRRPPRNVLIEGETGSGKELVARHVAERLRAGKPYAAVNVAGVAAGVFDSQLFGYVAGAYSGSGRGSPGIIARHDGGTVFLDELGELALELQPKLLRLLDNREILPVGADRPSLVDVLVIAATNRTLEAMVAQGSFRRDLFTRFAAARLDLPPLRERAEDVLAIALALAARSGDAIDPKQCDVEAIEALMLHPWPGNVRELDGALSRARSLDPAPGIRFAALDRVLGPRFPAPSGTAPVRPSPLTRDRVELAMAECGGNRSVAARKLGVSRGALLRSLKAFGIE